MKIIHYDGERLVAETLSLGLLWQWIVFIFFSLLWLWIGGGIIAQTRSIRCEKIEPTLTNCQITDSLFWGAFRQIQKVSGVQRAFVAEAIGYSDASQYPIYQVGLVLNNSKTVRVTDWERSSDYTNQVKNSLETFLKSERTTYQLNLNNYRNILGAIFFIVVNFFNLMFFLGTPYRERIILSKTDNNLLLIKYFILTVLKQSLFLDQVSLQLKEETDSDNDTFYTVVLNTTGIGDKSYRLKSSGNRQEVEDYWRFDPDIQALKEFVRAEELLPPP
ncbi:hypothetical protein [Synechococcus sp. C9]|uniref:hypothetical protein n=1 Tax=Synechococcus sp. C9 TaxID=102119 RepID=UPI001FF3D963|nr:hypothetical protein [Synechococcus sp. C9]